MEKLIFDHIGIACDDITTMISYMEKFFPVEHISKIIHDPLQDATLCMLTLQDNIKIELISGEVVKKLVKKRNYLYHTCYAVHDIDAMVSALVAEGSFLISQPQPAILFNGRKVAFLTSEIGIIELLEMEE